MGIVAVDSSGLVDRPPVWMVAVRKVNVQKDNVLLLSETECDNYKEGIEKNWREKLSAVLIFKSLEPLVKHFDIIQIDKDFLGQRQDWVEEYLRKLFGKKFYGKYPLSGPKIQFIPDRFSEDVKVAHKKSRLARHKKIKSQQCPNLWNYLKWLD